MSNNTSFEQYGRAWLFSFPFWLVIDGNEKLQNKEVSIGKHSFRFYPPFRSGDANFLPMPHIRPMNIPFLPGTEIKFKKGYTGKRVSALPMLARNENKEVAVRLFIKEDLKILPSDQLHMDSMRIDLIEKIGEIEEVRPNDFILKFLSILRVLSNQWWITRSVDRYLGYIRQFFTIDRIGRLSSELEGLISCHTAYGNEKLISSEIWMDALNQLENGCSPNQIDLYMLDVLYYGAINDIERGLLNCSMALELVLEETYERLWKKNSSANFKRGRVMQGDGIPEHLSTDLERFYSRSYKNERSDNFFQIENMWLARGNVAHGGQAEFYRDGEHTIVDKEQLTKYYYVIESCIKWLRAIN